MTRLPVIIPLVLLAALAAAPAASAGDIKVEHVVPTCTGGDECRYFNEPPYDNHTFVAKDGEVNAVVATRGSNGTVTFRDNGAPIGDATNCTRIAANEVRCTSRIAIVDTGDMNDTLTVDEVNGLGGSGDDTITGGDNVDFLNGGAGRDTLRGGAGRDVLSDGNDGATDDADVYDGGTDGAEVSYFLSKGIVNANLAVLGATQGEAGEGDRFVGVTEVTGGNADDVLTAAPGGSVLSGAGGADALVGGDGDDQIAGGAGRNSIDAGGGRDSILTSSSGLGQSVACGAGPDTVNSPRRRDLVGQDCETVNFDEFPIVRQRLPLRRLTGLVAKVRDFGCFDTGRPSVELRVARYWRRKGQPRRGTLIGRRAGSKRACSGKPVLSVRLSSRGRRLIRRYGLLPVEVRVNDPGNRSRYVTEIRRPGS